MKRRIFATTVLILAGIGIYLAQSSDKNADPYSDLLLANAEALTEDESGTTTGITVVGCRPMKGATCYVFDGNGQLVDKQKNQYPGD